MPCIGRCIGTVLNMSSWVKRLTPLWLLMIVTILRLAGVLSICWCAYARALRKNTHRTQDIL